MAVLSVRELVLWSVLLVAPCGAVAAIAQTIDPHRVYEQNCAGCHEAHAGDFVHDHLVGEGDGIRGRKSGRALAAFLEAGHGRLAPPEIDAMVAHLTSIQRSGRLFHDKCLICHGRAVKLARKHLVVVDNKLIGRYSGRDMTQFLANHGRLEPDEVARMVATLKRQLATRED